MDINKPTDDSSNSKKAAYDAKTGDLKSLVMTDALHISRKQDHRDVVLQFCYSMKFTESINALIRLGQQGQMTKKNSPKWLKLCNKYMDVGSALYEDEKINLNEYTKTQVDRFFELIISEIKSNPRCTAKPSQEHYKRLFDAFMIKFEKTGYNDYKVLCEEYRKKHMEMDILIPYFKRDQSCRSDHNIPHCDPCGWPGAWVENFKKRGIYISTARHWTEIETCNVWRTGVNPDSLTEPDNRLEKLYPQGIK